MSQWSGWSKCTKDCESGVEGKTRSILVKPKHGGKGCDAVEEERACNTGSCDRNCKLAPWSEWSPCSMACNGGLKTRTKKVVIPIRGQGKCPSKRSRRRNQRAKCNKQKCVGDEICVAKQDLVLALDASGSLRESGYETVKKFALNLTSRYKSEYFGNPAIKMGVVLFGNGQLIPLRRGSGTTIKAAINLQPLTFDLPAVRTKIEATTWQRGFTNMAQAFSTADIILGQGGRSEAQSAVMVISDGKYSLKYNNALFVQKLIVKFCPDSMSPSLRVAKESIRGYILIHKDGWASDECGEWMELEMTANKDECAEAARKVGLPGFAFGKEEAVGECYGETIFVTQDYFDKYKIDHKSPAPACGNKGNCPAKCEWLENPYFNSYIINPLTMGKQKADS